MMGERKYNLSWAELIDRATIVAQKVVFSTDHKEEFEKELAAIIHDIDLMIMEGVAVNGEAIKAIMFLMLVNSHIWENESALRGDGIGADLPKTHRLNADRAHIKKRLSELSNNRIDHKLNYNSGEWNIKF